MPRRSTISDADIRSILAEMDQTGDSLAAVARRRGRSDDAVRRAKATFDRRVAAGEIRGYTRDIGAELAAIAQQLESLARQVKAMASTQK